MNYTKGEWKVQGRFLKLSAFIGTEYSIYSDDNYELARVFLHNGEQKFNAHLISAAPDMYEALKIAEVRIHNEIRHHPEAGDYRKILQDELRQVMKALAKAEGR